MNKKHKDTMVKYGSVGKNNSKKEFFYTKFYVSLALTIFLNVTVSQAQKPNVQFLSLSLEQGLSQTSVVCIAQDQQGFMWFGTQDGLNRYDGYDFIVHRHDSHNPNSIAKNYIQTLLVDRTGQLWIGTHGGGLSLYHAKTETFIAFKNNPHDPSSLSSNIVRSIYEDSSGRLWVGTEDGGLNLFDPNKKTFSVFKHNPEDSSSLSNNEVLSIVEGHNGQLWVGTSGGGLNLLDTKTKKFKHYKNDPAVSSSLSNNFVLSLYKDRYGHLWVGTEGGLNLLDPKKNTFRRFKNSAQVPFSLSNDRVRTIFEDKSGRLWIGTGGGGLNLFDTKTEKFETYKNDPKNSSSLSGDYVYSIYEDHSGRLWVGINGGGVCIFDTKAKKFTSYKNIPHNPLSLPTNSVFSIYKDRSDQLWLGTWGEGLILFDRDKQIARVYKHDPHNPFSLSNNVVFSICEDRSGSLWIGTYGGGLNMLDRKTNAFKPLKHNPRDASSLSNDNIFSIFEDRHDRLWVGTEDGLNLYDPKTQSFKVFKNNPNDSSSLSHNNVYDIYEDRSGNLWIGTWGGGLNLYDAKSKTFRVFRNDPNDPTSLSSNFIMCIYEDVSNSLWIGTDGEGLNLFNPITKSFRSFQEKQGLPNGIIYGILEDQHGRLWMSTNKGISCFNLEAKIFKNYDNTDGMMVNSEFNQNGYFKDNDGTMYFGGMNGLTVFHPDSIREDDYQPPIVLTAFKLFNTPVTVGQQYDGFVLPQSITETDELILSYRESVFTLEFSALMFTQPMKHTYAYRLEGFDKDWNYTNAKRRFATYTNLDPGTYTFHVKGSNHDGVWNEDGRTLKIIITPPWWETWWFRALLVVGIISVLMLAYKYRVRQIIKIEKLRADIASDLHDEVGSSLGSIALMTERMAIHPSFENQEREKLLTISGVARRTLEAMSDIVWAIQPYVGRRDDFFLRIKEITAELLTQEHLTYRLHLPEKGAPLSMLIRKNTVLIYKEILHNILKHSKASHVLIDIALHGHAMYWTIQDNGIGMNNPIKTGNGMKNMKKRAEALGGTIEFSSEQGQGVTIKLVCQLSS